jgi:hypothetical protein
MQNEYIEKIRSRCYWQATIRPDEFTRKRVKDFSLLFPIVENSVVHLGGWPFPVFSGEASVRSEGHDWVGEEIDWQFGPSLWRLYQSGQFISVSAMRYDWTGRSKSNPDGDGPQDFLPLWDTIRQFTEIYEFAARLSLTDAGDSAVHVEVKIGNIQNRFLNQDNPRKTPLRYYTIKAPEFLYPGPGTAPIPRDDLVADPRGLAADGLADLFKRFGFDAGAQAIRAWQDELDKR